MGMGGGRCGWGMMWVGVDVRCEWGILLVGVVGYVVDRVGWYLWVGYIVGRGWW